MEEANAVSRFFCSSVNALPQSSGVRFSFSFDNGHARVILTGPARTAAEIIQRFYSR